VLGIRCSSASAQDGEGAKGDEVKRPRLGSSDGHAGRISIPFAIMVRFERFIDICR
jgi:hypothetical protein